VAAQRDVCMRAAVLLAELLVCLTSFRDYNTPLFCVCCTGRWCGSGSGGVRLSWETRAPTHSCTTFALRESCPIANTFALSPACRCSHSACVGDCCEGGSCTSLRLLAVCCYKRRREVLCCVYGPTANGSRRSSTLHCRWRWAHMACGLLLDAPCGQCSCLRSRRECTLHCRW